jgi:hypothetical protein
MDAAQNKRTMDEGQKVYLLFVHRPLMQHVQTSAGASPQLWFLSHHGVTGSNALAVG